MIKPSGFRSGKTWKKVLASFGYLLILLIIIGTIGCSESNQKSTNSPSTTTPLIQENTNDKSDNKSDELTNKSSTDSTPINNPENSSDKTSSTSLFPEQNTQNTQTQNTQTIEQNKQGTTVYITKSGEKYHSDGCRSLSKSKIPIDLSNAKSKGYAPCNVCNPPQ